MQAESAAADLLGGDRLTVVHETEQSVDLVLRECGFGLARGDDQVGGELDLGEKLGVLEGDVELVVHHANTPPFRASRIAGANGQFAPAAILTDAPAPTHSHLGQTRGPRRDPVGALDGAWWVRRLHLFSERSRGPVRGGERSPPAGPSDPA